LSRCFSKERAGKSVRPGANLVIDGVPHRVAKITQGKRGKGGGFVRATLKNIKSAQVFEKTFTSDEMVEHADMEREKYQYSWNDGNLYVFINTVSFEEVQLLKEDVDKAEFLVEGQEVMLLMFNDAVMGVELPLTLEYAIDEVLGSENGSSGGYHSVRLSSGATVLVPEHLKEGDVIKVNNKEAKYVGVVSKA
jgi:elongation factor P